MSDNKFFDVFIGPPWSGVCDTWPGVNTLGDGDIADPTGATNKSYLQFFNSTISNPTEATGKYITTSALWKFTFGGANARLNSDGETISYPDDGDISLGNWLLLDSNFDYLPQ